MKTASLQLLPSTSHGSATGNYNGTSLTFAGGIQKAANYYLQGTGLQTVAFFTTALVGTVTVEATLETTPTSDADWFTVYTLPGTTPLTGNSSTNITGNFTWIRARVSNFTAGTINKITLSY
jgi:hypothetical protein